jgi:hypothetical protein
MWAPENNDESSLSICLNKFWHKFFSKFLADVFIEWFFVSGSIDIKREIIIKMRKYICLFYAKIIPFPLDRKNRC